MIPPVSNDKNIDHQILFFYLFQHFYKLVIINVICTSLWNDFNNHIHSIFHRICFRKPCTNISNLYYTMEQRREASVLLGFLLYIYLLSLQSALCKMCQSGGLFVLSEVLTGSQDLPLFYFCGLFPSLSFSHHPSVLLFPILTS